MGEALFELEQILRSNQENLTSQEANVLMQCKSNALKHFTVGAAVGGCVTWLATRSLRNFLRINLSAGTAAAYGFWRFGRSLDSCIEHILSLDGSRMQKELANIMLKKNRDDEWTMQLISKHFYLEKVFDDSSADQPMLRWRYRNFFGDHVTHSQRSHDKDSYSDVTDSERTDMENANEPKQVSRNIAIDATADAFDCIFGVVPDGSEEIHHTNTAGTYHRRHGRGHKRSHHTHRMRRMRRNEVPSTVQFA